MAGQIPEGRIPEACPRAAEKFSLRFIKQMVTMNMSNASAEKDGGGLEWIVGHRLRQRERSMNGSWDDFRNHELLEVLLGCVVPRQDLSKLSRELTGRYGSVLNVLCAPAEELLAVEGMTPAMAAWLNQAGELTTLYRKADGGERISLFRFEDVCRFLKPRMAWARPPECWMLYTNFEHHLISCQRLPQGRRWWDPENVRAMVEDCVSLQARHAIIVVFRGRRPLPMSENEKQHLHSVNNTISALQVALLDCVLAGGAGVYSMFIHDRFEFTRGALPGGGLYEAVREDRDGPDEPEYL